MGVISGFYGEHRWLSNFWACRVHYEGLDYPSSENAYQAAKMPREQRLPLTMCLPGEAKRMAPRNHNRQWLQRRVAVMREVLDIKFDVQTREARWLVNTGDAELIETNNWNDRFWGVCDGEGLNTLGHLLMERREQLCALLSRA
jgi:ribA/ribD-fused uncharacterized protein